MLPPSTLQAVEAIYHDHHQWLCGWLRRKLDNAAEAADLAQDVFIRVLQCRDWQTPREPRAWLTTTATRLLIDQVRRRAIERSYLDTMMAAAPNALALPSSEQLYEVVETLAAILRMLDGLAERPRAAFLLHRIDGLPQAEIAVRLGVSTSMVKQYIAQVMVHCYAAEHGI